MEAGSPRWTTVSDSPHDHEREALAFLRRRLPDREPYRVWSNLEFTTSTGKLYEVDALAITDNGVHLIEIKSRPGRIGGDGATWQWTTPEGKRRTFDNPPQPGQPQSHPPGAAGAVEGIHQAPGRRAVRERNGLPLRPDLTVTLSPPGRHQVFGRDPDEGQELPTHREAIGGVIDALTSLVPATSGRAARRLHRPTGARIVEAIEQAGIRERVSRRRFGDYRIVELLADVDADGDTGVAYQDFLVEHTSLTGVRRRLRPYPLEQNATTEQREAAGRAARREFQHLHQLQHPGILAPIDYFEHERGPCLLFEHDPQARSLDRWLLDPPAEVDLHHRPGIVRQVAEAVAHAHGNGVFHRALCPLAILVAGDPEKPAGAGRQLARRRTRHHGRRHERDGHRPRRRARRRRRPALPCSGTRPAPRGAGGARRVQPRLPGVRHLHRRPPGADASEAPGAAGHRALCPTRGDRRRDRRGSGPLRRRPDRLRPEPPAGRPRRRAPVARLRGGGVELAAMGGVASAEQLAARLAHARPAPGTELALDGEHRRNARAMVRAAVATEGERQSARWVRRVLAGPVVVALDAAGGPDGNRLADYAAALAARTSELVAAGGGEPVMGRAALVDALRSLAPPDGARPLSDAALAELAASLCPDAAVNSRLELYPRGLPAAEALKAARRAFIAARRVTPAELATKVAARFPAAAPLPDRPDLDRVVADAGLDLRWSPAEAAYLAPAPAHLTGDSGSTLSRHATGVPAPSVTPVEIDVAADFDARLRNNLDSGGLLALVTERRWLDRCQHELERLAVTPVDLDDLLVAEVERITESGRPSWDLIVEVDGAGPASARWRNLTTVVDRALDAVTARLAATTGTVLLTRCGLLARYKRLDIVARWRDAVHDSSTPLDALWLLVAAPGTTDVPMLDGQAVPVLTRNEWARVPDDWLRNAHGTARPVSGNR